MEQLLITLEGLWSDTCFFTFGSQSANKFEVGIAACTPQQIHIKDEKLVFYLFWDAAVCPFFLQPQPSM
jgi:hypothetical protein